MMTRIHRRTAHILIVLTLSLGLACTSTDVGPPPSSDRFPINPRLGWKGSVSGRTVSRFDRAWAALLAGRIEFAASEFKSQANLFPPSALALGILALDQGDFATAQERVDAALATDAEWIAATAIRAELDAAQGNLDAAQKTYAELALRSDVSASIRTRERAVTTRLFEELTALAANTKDHSVAIDILRRAVAIRPDTPSARLLLVERITEAKRFDDARKELDPLIASNPLDPQVQLALVELDVGRERYQEAITRLETLIRQNPDPAKIERLGQIKRLWNDAHLPSQYNRAVTSAAITREDLAVLIYWKILPVRFAANLPEPPIAIDMEGIRGRNELIRALSLRLFSVDPVTREAHPGWVVPRSTFIRAVSSVAMWSGAPCARGAVGEGAVMAACGLDIPAGPEDSVRGVRAAAILDALARQIASREE